MGTKTEIFPPIKTETSLSYFGFKTRYGILFKVYLPEANEIREINITKPIFVVKNGVRSMREQAKVSLCEPTAVFRGGDLMIMTKMMKIAAVVAKRLEDEEDATTLIKGTVNYKRFKELAGAEPL